MATTFNDKSAKIKESIQVRGIAAGIQSMAFPTIQNLNELLGHLGYEVKKKSTATVTYNRGL